MGYHRRNPRFQDNRMDFNGNNRPFMYDSRNRYNAGRNNYNNRRNPFRGPRRGGNNRFNRRRPVTEEDPGQGPGQVLREGIFPVSEIDGRTPK